MALLRKRLERFLEDIASGRVKLAKDVLDQLRPDLDLVRREPDGLLDLSSCSPHLRSTARAYYLAATALDSQGRPTPDISQSPTSRTIIPDTAQIRDLNRTLFTLWAELFQLVTGYSPDGFVPPGSSFDAEIRLTGERLSQNPRVAERRLALANDKHEELLKYYRAAGGTFATAASIPGQKLVLGGSQNFSASSSRAVRSMLLYTDTVLIPDPVFRWIEKEPITEAFPRVRMLEDIYHLSQLRPLIEADLPTCPLLVFPSWEKLLEDHDETTRDGIERLILSVISAAFDSRFEDIEEVAAFARERPADFLQRVDAQRLFVALGGSPEDKLKDAVARHRGELRQLRSEQAMKLIDSMSDPEVVLLGITERLGPQFHVMENAESLHASPLFALPVQWHYFGICHHASSRHLQGSGKLSNKTIRVVEGLSQRNVSWLGNVPIPDLIRLRAEMANIDFRKQLDTILSDLDASSENNLDSSLYNVATAIDKLLVDHELEARQIEDEYRRRNAQTGTAFLLSFGAQFLPWLPVAAPIVTGTTALGKFAIDTVHRQMRRSQLSKTVMGVLAASARNQDR